MEVGFILFLVCKVYTNMECMMTRRRATEMAEMSLREINEYEYKKNTHDCMYYRIPVGRMSDRCNGSPRVCSTLFGRDVPNVEKGSMFW